MGSKRRGDRVDDEEVRRPNKALAGRCWYLEEESEEEPQELVIGSALPIGGRLQLVMHPPRDIDDITATVALILEGESQIPGISNAEIVFIDDRSRFVGRSEEDLLREGIILVGIGGGMFDEHPVNGSREPGVSAATIVGDFLGVRDDPRWSDIFDYTAADDANGSSGNWELSRLVKEVSLRHPNDPMRVFNWAREAIEAKRDVQEDFHIQAREEYHAKAVIHEVKRPKRSRISIVTVESDDLKVSGFALSKWGCRAGAVIQKESSGNVQVRVNSYYRIDLREAARILRMEEMKAEGTFDKVFDAFDWRDLCDDLRRDGKVGTATWHFENTKWLLNGSLTGRVEPTKLPLELITEVVCTALGNDFEATRAETCRQNVCLSTRRRPCSWYDWRLARCASVRKVQFEAKQKIRIAAGVA